MAIRITWMFLSIDVEMYMRIVIKQYHVTSKYHMLAIYYHGHFHQKLRFFVYFVLGVILCQIKFPD